MKIVKQPDNSPPKHLSKRSADFWRSVDSKFALEPHDVERLRAVCEAMDTVDAAEAALRKDGLFTKDRYGGRRSHPAIVVARDARQAVLRGLREMNLDVEPPQESRIPRGRRYA